MIKKKSIFVICILLIILSFTGCLNRNAITEAETEERIPAFISKMESVLTNYKMNDDLRMDYSNESNDFPAFISVSDNKRKYHISVYIYNIECAEKFTVKLQWSPKIENGKPMPEDILQSKM